MMENELTVFTNEQFGQVRGINFEGESWLVGNDVVEALGYDLKENSYSKYMKRFCDEEDYILIDSKTQVQNGLEFDYKQLGQRGGYLVNESGLYSLVFGSDLPEAKKFKRWVTSEVLPQIRQTGGYIPIKEEDDELTIMSKAFMIAQKTIDNKQQQIEQQQQLIEQQQEVIEQRQEVIELQQEVINNQQEVIESQRDKVDFANTVSESEDDEIDMGTMAKLLSNKGFEIDGKKIGRNTLFEFLRNSNILMNDNLPYQTYINRGYFIVVEYTMWKNNKTKLCRQTLVTGKGQLYITKKVKEYCENKNNENNK